LITHPISGLAFSHPWVDNSTLSRPTQIGSMSSFTGEGSGTTHADSGIAIEESVLALVPRIRALLTRWSGDIELAKDLSQDVIFGLLQAIRSGRLRSAEALPAYAHKSARNALLMSVRKRTPEFTDALPETSAAWSDAPSTPLEACERGELGSMAQAALDCLATRRDREIMRGFYAEGRSKAELMEEFDLTRDQFDRVISRARGRMRDLLRQKYPRVAAATNAGCPPRPAPSATEGSVP
jgi:RNA polymerase sigma factor (sigma-70 family)